MRDSTERRAGREPLKNPRALSYHGTGLKNLSPAQLEQAAAASGLPLYHYVVPAAIQDGLHYDGYVVGASPKSPMPVSVPTWVVPLRLHFLDQRGNEVFRFSPEAANPCLSGMSASMLTGNSPLFNATPYVMNGQSVGNTQYVDAFRRADLWSKVKNTNYHLFLSPTLMPSLDIYVLYGGGPSASGPVRHSALLTSSSGTPLRSKYCSRSSAQPRTSCRFF